jgi:hypothetical protein
LPGVTIFIEGTSTGTITDLDGNFNLSVEPGEYDLRVSFISYETLIISGVKVVGGEVNSLGELKLEEATISLNEVTVTAKAVRNTETALISIKRRSPNMIDGISSGSLKMIGDSDAASAMKRVSGVSVSQGKYVYVRGLGISPIARKVVFLPVLDTTLILILIMNIWIIKGVKQISLDSMMVQELFLLLKIFPSMRR